MLHQNNHTLRSAINVILGAFIAACLYATFAIHHIYIILALAFSSGLWFVRYKRIQLTAGELIYRDYSILPFFNIKRIISLSSIASIEHFESQFDKSFFLVDLLFPTSWRGYSAPETVVLKLVNNESFSFIRFGKRKSFRAFVDQLKRIQQQG